MKILGTINGEDVFPGKTFVHDGAVGELRQAVRIVLFDESKKIALGYYPPKDKHPEGEYNLPGGGVDEGESIGQALQREALEETGCCIKNIEELGIIKESQVGKEIKHYQDTYCFIADLKGSKMTPIFTKRELEDKLEVRWVSLEDAIKFIENRQQSFGKIRSLICLQEVINSR